MSRLFIIGSGGLALDVVWLIETSREIQTEKQLPIELIGFVADSTSARPGRYPLLGDDEWAMQHLDRDLGFVVAIANPSIRKKLATRYEAAGFQPVSLIHPAAHVADADAIGAGSIICVGAVVSPQAKVSRHVIINIHTTVGHDSVIGDFATISPGVHIGGNVRIGPEAEIGSGATILQGLHIGAGAVLGAGGVAIRDLDAHATYVGVPARKVKQR